MKLQNQMIMSPISRTEIKKLTAVVDETICHHEPSIEKKITVAQFDRILRQRRVFTTRRFL